MFLNPQEHSQEAKLRVIYFPRGVMNNPEQKSRSEIQKTEHGPWKSRPDDTKNMHSQTHSSFSFPLMSGRDHFNQSFRSGCKSDLRQGDGSTL